MNKRVFNKCVLIEEPEYERIMEKLKQLDDSAVSKEQEQYNQSQGAIDKNPKNSHIPPPNQTTSDPLEAEEPMQSGAGEQHSETESDDDESVFVRNYNEANTKAIQGAEEGELNGESLKSEKKGYFEMNDFEHLGPPGFPHYQVPNYKSQSTKARDLFGTGHSTSQESSWASNWISLKK